MLEIIVGNLFIGKERIHPLVDIILIYFMGHQRITVLFHHAVDILLAAAEHLLGLLYFQLLLHPLIDIGFLDFDTVLSRHVRCENRGDIVQVEFLPAYFGQYFLIGKRIGKAFTRDEARDNGQRKYQKESIHRQHAIRFSYSTANRAD